MFSTDVEAFRRRSNQPQKPLPSEASGSDSEEASEHRADVASPPAGGGHRQVALELAGQIEEILATAERTAATIQSEAEAAAQRYLAERRREADRELEERLGGAGRALHARAAAIANISSSLRHEAERVLERLKALEQAASEAARPAPAETGSGPPSGSLAVEAAGPVADDDEGRSHGAPVEALLRAAQMAVAGSGREEIKRALVAEFNADAPDSIVDEVLGP